MERPIHSLLIANRGEIACRIIKTARRMGIRTVAIFSEADKDARHVVMADNAFCVGPPPVIESYLNVDAILNAAEASEADAIHPGYGFLSENPDFVRRVEDAGMIFVGPSEEVVRKFGLKDQAKALMEKAGVPVVPGYHGSDQSLEALKAAAADIGYPVLIKAVAGGGGKGMRAVSFPDAFENALHGARAEARPSFGNDDVLIEKLIQNPRHIEIQVFGDGVRALHLFERDCSLQRRHQKVLEEAPAPGMTEEMRTAMSVAAVRAAEAVGYRGAGTVEFIVDASDGLRSDRFWFMEMNTRLQVEHPVTEAITGVDLVEWQLRVAAGEPLPLQQSDLRIDGHAVEVRLYAEDPCTGFLPSTGCLTHLSLGDSVRVDTGVNQGDVITPYYDPMIAKLIMHKPDRETAFSSIEDALLATEIAGVETNIGFLHRLVRDPRVRQGQVDTSLIERRAEQLTVEPSPSDQAKALAVARLVEENAGSGFALWGPLRHHVGLADEKYVITRSGSVTVVSGACGHFEFEWRNGAWWIDGRKSELRAIVSGEEVVVFGEGGGRFAIDDPLNRLAIVTRDGSVTAPMPGRVTNLFVAEGDTVQAGQALATIEAMKMEHTVTADIDGDIETLFVSRGAQVEAGSELFRLVPHAVSPDERKPEKQKVQSRDGSSR